MGFLLPAVCIVFFDQATKQFFWHLGKNFDVLDGILRVTLVKNTGAAFGMFQGSRVFFIIASIIASILIAYVAARTPRTKAWRRLMLGLVLGGAFGNLIDRTLFGEVIDFIDMGIGTYRWPVYNIADLAVTVGAVGLVIDLTRSREQLEQRSPDQAGKSMDEQSNESDGG